MQTKKLLFYCVSVLLGGCVPVISLHPLFTKEDVVFEDRLLGKWVDDAEAPKSIWEFRRGAKSGDEPVQAYELVLSDEKGEKGLFAAHLVKLEGRLFLDVFPAKLPWEPEDPSKVDWPYNAFFLIPGHAFARVDNAEGQLKIRFTSDEKIKELLKDKPEAVRHELVEERVILTASTKELQRFVLKYADHEKVFPNEVVLGRQQN